MRLFLLSFLLPIGACTIHSSFSGPGWDDALLTDAPGPFLAVATHTRPVRETSDRFDEHVTAIAEQLETQPGLVGSSFRGRLFGREVWTLTVWEDEESVVEFVTSGAHLEAMGDSVVIEGIETVEWDIAPTEMPPTWNDVDEHLDALGTDEPW